MSRPELPPASPAYQKLEQEHPDVFPQIFALQVGTSLRIEQAGTVGELNTAGLEAFEALNDFGEWLSTLSLAPDELELLDHCIDDARFAIRGRAELRMAVLDANSPK